MLHHTVALPPHQVLKMPLVTLRSPVLSPRNNCFDLKFFSPILVLILIVHGIRLRFCMQAAVAPDVSFWLARARYTLGALLLWRAVLHADLQKLAVIEADFPPRRIPLTERVASVESSKYTVIPSAVCEHLGTAHLKSIDLERHAGSVPRVHHPMIRSNT